MESLAGGGGGPTPRVFEEIQFRHLLSLEVSRCTRYQDFLCLCLVRIERPADAAMWLRDSLAQKLAELFRSTDIVGVIDDQVAALLLHISDTDAAAIIDRVQQRVETHAFPSSEGGAVVRVAIETSSVSFPGDGTTAAQLLARAQGRFRPLS